jgi:hypothetical protein
VWHSRPRLWNFVAQRALEELKRNAPKKRPKSLLTISELQLTYAISCHSLC